MAKTNHECFIDLLSRAIGEEDEIRVVESETEGLAGISLFIYRDYPEEGFITAVTYGLSLAEHEDWKLSRPEVMICLETKNEEWVVQLAKLVNRFRGVSPFCYGETFVSAEPLCDGSKMDGFVVFAPPFLSADEFSTALPDGGRLHVSALYPIYREEAEFIKQVGLERFWKSDDLQDIYSINRASIVK